MNDLLAPPFGEPKPAPDEYLTWPLDKLQAEYRKLRLERTFKDIQRHEMERTVAKAQAFIDAFNAMVEPEGEI